MCGLLAQVGLRFKSCLNGKFLNGAGEWKTEGLTEPYIKKCAR